MNSKVEFIDIVHYSFIDYTVSMNKDIRSKIDSALIKYDLENVMYGCERMLHFSIGLDSCGYIKSCTPSVNNKVIGNYKDFEREVVSIVLNSNWQVKNKFKSSNTNFIVDEDVFDSFRFSFTILCDPFEIEYFEYIVPKENKVFVYYSEKGSMYFSGFKEGCH